MGNLLIYHRFLSENPVARLLIGSYICHYHFQINRMLRLFLWSVLILRAWYYIFMFFTSRKTWKPLWKCSTCIYYIIISFSDNDTVKTIHELPYHDILPPPYQFHMEAPYNQKILSDSFTWKSVKMWNSYIMLHCSLAFTKLDMQFCCRGGHHCRYLI